MGKEDNSKLGTLVGSPRGYKSKLDSDFNSNQFESDLAPEPLDEIPEGEDSDNSGSSDSSDKK